jgi:transposase InsO family protein
MDGILSAGSNGPRRLMSTIFVTQILALIVTAGEPSYQSKPGRPQQNGRHERMHLTLKKEASKPPALSFLQQQARFDEFIEIFNNERPHEALDMKCPAEVYQPATRTHKGLRHTW